MLRWLVSVGKRCVAGAGPATRKRKGKEDEGMTREVEHCQHSTDRVVCQLAKRRPELPTIEEDWTLAARHVVQAQSHINDAASILSRRALEGGC